jgi:uncharacterized protein YdiU (UPF0061 family)
MERDGLDFTNTFRALSDIAISKEEALDDFGTLAPLAPLFIDEGNKAITTPTEIAAGLEERRKSWVDWIGSYRARVLEDYRAEGGQLGLEEFEARRKLEMRRVNPRFVLRNHLLHRAIELAEKEANFEEIRKLHRLLLRPFDDESVSDSSTSIDVDGDGDIDSTDAELMKFYSTPVSKNLMNAKGIYRLSCSS